MNKSIHMPVKRCNRRRPLGQSGVAAVEMAIILPLMLLIIFALIDFGMIFDAKFIITNMAREGASLGSRDVQSATNLISMLQSGARPLDLASSGKIYIWKIRAGATKNAPKPTIDSQNSAAGGNLSVQSSINTNSSTLGLSSALYNRLVFNISNNTSDISDITVVEVFYKYMPITPLANLVPGLLAGNGGGRIIGSKAVF